MEPWASSMSQKKAVRQSKKPAETHQSSKSTATVLIGRGREYFISVKWYVFGCRQVLMGILICISEKLGFDYIVTGQQWRKRRSDQSRIGCRAYFTLMMNLLIHFLT